MGCKCPEGPELLWSSARSEPKGSGAPARRRLARRQPAGPERRLATGLARAVAAACLAAAAAPASAPAQGEAAREAEAAEPGAARAPGDPGATLGAVESGVREADTWLREARFEEALDRTDRVRVELGALGAGPEARRLRARNEVMAATAHVALDQDDAARECFRRALAAEPALDLDPATTAPKVLRVFRAVRAEPRGPR